MIHEPSECGERSHGVIGRKLKHARRSDINFLSGVNKGTVASECERSVWMEDLTEAKEPGDVVSVRNLRK